MKIARLHTAIRLILPVIPALAASSPYEERNRTNYLDNRMKHYGRNSSELPTIAGQIVPEPIESEEESARKIFEPMFQEMLRSDPESLMEKNG